MKVLIIDDDVSIVETLGIALQLQWPTVQVFGALDGEQGLALFRREAPDLTLLDVNMPVLNGWDVLRQIRAFAAAPVILLTARGEEIDKVKGLELGADDYLTKPFSHLELFARIKAVLRRVGPRASLPFGSSVVVGDLVMNLDNHAISVRGNPVRLTPTEYKLLDLLVRNAGRVLPSETLLTRIWGDEYRTATDYLKTYVSRLRRKLGDPPAGSRYILTERGVGYGFARPTATAGALSG